MTDHHDLLIIESDEPTSFEEAMMGPYSDILLEASISELENLRFVCKESFTND